MRWIPIPDNDPETINKALDQICKLISSQGGKISDIENAPAPAATSVTTVTETLVATNWTETTGTFTQTPFSTSVLTMIGDVTASIKVGMSLKYIIGGVTKYGMVGAITSTALTVNGAPLSGFVSNLYYGGGTIRQVVIIIPDLYGDASNTALITTDLKSSFIWTLPKSYCVHFRVYSDVHDTGAHGQASVRIGGSELCTTVGGPTIAADKTWVPTVVDIDVANYDINPGDALEVTCIKGGGGVATDLTVEMVFITP